MRSELILLIDNYDSFVHNLARYLRRLGQETLVVRNDQISVARVIQLQPQAIVLSPGPCTPKHAGCCLDLVDKLHDAIPMLGVCLGHQVIAEAFGGRVSRAKRPVHGQAGLGPRTLRDRGHPPDDGRHAGGRRRDRDGLPEQRPGLSIHRSTHPRHPRLHARAHDLPVVEILRYPTHPR